MPRLPLTLLLLFSLALQAQTDTARQTSPVRRIFLAGSTALVAGGSLAYLNAAWYSRYNTGRFHYFNDNDEWLQMDKAGHAYSSYQISRLMMQSFSWAGFSRNTTLYAGGSVGFLYLTAVEVMDGFSRGWGFSWGDQAANIFGSGLAMAQEAAWKRQNVMLKFSYFASEFAQYNPPLLGESAMTRILKDYNAQTYWMSFSPFVFSDLPKWRWLCISVGYGATGMTGGHENKEGLRDAQGNPVEFERRRLLYLSLDVDLTRLDVRSRFLKNLFSALNVLKVPAPAISFSGNGARFYGLR